MTQAEGKGLLFHLLQRQTVIIPHPYKLFDLLILLCGNVYLTIVVVSKATRNKLRIPFVCLDQLLPSGNRHGRRSQNNALDIVRRQIPIQRKSQATSFITAYKQRIVTVVEAHSLQVIQHLAVVPFHFLGVLCFLFFVRVAAERKIFFMYVHSYVNCAIIHFSDLHLYAVIPVTLIVFQS